MIHLDFETRSFADLKKVGAYTYAKHRTTQVLCAAYAIDRDEIKTFEPWVKGPITELTRVQAIPESGTVNRSLFDCPPDLRARVEAGDLIVAHNAFFERCIWDLLLTRYFGWPRVHPSQWVCSMAAALYSGLPGALKDAAAVIGTPQQKGSNRVMLKMCKPRPTWLHKGTGDPWFGTPDEYRQLVEYCVQDVETERALYDACDHLPPRERAIWELDQKINWKGIPIDRGLAEGAWKIVEHESKKAIAKLGELTGGAVTSPKQRDAMLNWVNDHGVTAENMQAATVDRLFADERTPENVKEVLEIRKALGGAAFLKYRSFLDKAGNGHTIHGELRYYGAHTGRWTSKEGAE